NAESQRHWLDSLQPEDPRKPDGQQYGVRHQPTTLGREHDVFSRRRDPWLQLVHRLRPQQPGDARGLDQSDRIARRTSDGQYPHVESARSDLRAVTAAASPIADQLSKEDWTWGCSSQMIRLVACSSQETRTATTERGSSSAPPSVKAKVDSVRRKSFWWPRAGQG